jgi:hypothetical protein
VCLSGPGMENGQDSGSAAESRLGVPNPATLPRTPFGASFRAADHPLEVEPSRIRIQRINAIVARDLHAIHFRRVAPQSQSGQIFDKLLNAYLYAEDAGNSERQIHQGES